MYKLILAIRYLRTRYIALVSIVSVTLGVATMIVVNSVMSGFATEMKSRIHGILADMMIETTSTDGTHDPVALMAEVNRIAGDYIDVMTPTVEIYGMMSFDWAGQTIHRPVTLIGIVPESKNRVSPLAQYMLTRQDLFDDGKLIRGPLRAINDPLTWDLTPEDLQLRREMIEFQQFQQRVEHEFRPQNAGSGVTPVAAEAPAGDAQFDSFLQPAVGSSADSTAEAEDTIVDPFGPSTTQRTPSDPAAPMAARVFLGAGLVSFPYKDRETGGTHMMYMVQPGQDINLTTIKTGIPEPARFKATVVDIFKSGMSEYDSNLVFCNLEELQYARGMITGPDPTNPHQNLNWKDGEITTLQIKLKDYKDAPEVVRRLREELPAAYFSVRTWEQKQGPLLEAVEVESAILNVLLFLIIAVAGFGILAIFYMVVVEKTRDIGILKALGATSEGIMSIFLSYGLALGIVGAGAGVTLGLVFVAYINEIETALSTVTGRKVFDETIYYFQEIPTVVYPSMVAWVSLGAVLIAVLASILPAWRAASLHPVKSLRYE
ncbi:MAG: ABC transporter permease [Planctomycetaceae bacterium]|nr:ABC transporter permease [Planctomycetaceae bacterium]